MFRKPLAGIDTQRCDGVAAVAVQVPKRKLDALRLRRGPRAVENHGRLIPADSRRKRSPSQHCREHRALQWKILQERGADRQLGHQRRECRMVMMASIPASVTIRASSWGLRRKLSGMGILFAQSVPNSAAGKAVEAGNAIPIRSHCVRAPERARESPLPIGSIARNSKRACRRIPLGVSESVGTSPQAHRRAWIPSY